MKITRYAQSCILIETNGKRILVDPGSIQYDNSLLMNDWNNIDIILVTHKHGDHCHVPAILEIMKEGKTKLYSSTEVAKEYPELKIEIVKENDVVNIDDIKIEVVKAVHGFIPLLKGGKEVNNNIGYIIDDGKRRAYSTSDTICFDNDYKCNVLFAPVCNHGLVMGPFEAALFAKETGAELVVPVHYHNPKYPADLNEVERHFKENGLNYRIMEIKDSIEL